MNFTHMVYFLIAFFVIILVMAMIGKYFNNKICYTVLLIITASILASVSVKYTANIMHNTLLEIMIGSLIFCVFFGGVILLGKFLNNI